MRKRIYRDNAAKQKAYRARRKRRLGKVPKKRKLYRNAAHKHKAFRARKKKREADETARRLSENRVALENEWKGMPEFSQAKVRPYAVIVVRFATHEDLLEFSKLISQRVTDKTRSIWHPKLIAGNNHIQSDKRYVDESEVSYLRSVERPLGESQDGSVSGRD
jgi:hypothetical protein